MKYLLKIASSKAILLSNIVILASFSVIVKSDYMPSTSTVFEYYFALAGNVSLVLCAMSLMIYLIAVVSDVSIRSKALLPPDSKASMTNLSS
tara:strand:- start:1999 stop:2274 length:276 start_codon:yes stop_codon:yes gene_type:complete